MYWSAGLTHIDNFQGCQLLDGRVRVTIWEVVDGALFEHIIPKPQQTMTLKVSVSSVSKILFHRYI